MKKKKKLLLIIGGIVVVVAIVVANLTMNTSKVTEVKSDKAKLRDLVETVSASGRIQPQTKVDITSEINGEIIELYVQEGDYVGTGDLLVVLDTVQLQSDADQARYAVNEITARLEGAESSLEQAKDEFERQQKLFKNGLTSETIFKNAKYSYLNAKASYEATSAQSQQAQSRYEKTLDNLSKAKVVAPIPGTITFLDCEVGEIAAAQSAFSQGRTLMTISNLDVFEVQVDVDETEVSKVDLGQKVNIEVDAFPDTTFMGKVVDIGNTAVFASSGQEQSTNFRVKVIFKEQEERIRPGMSATVDITTNSHDNVLSIPYSAVVMRSLNLDSLERAHSAKSEDEDKTEPSGVQAAQSEKDDSSIAIKEEGGKREDVKGTFVIHDGAVKFVRIETGISDQKYIEIVSGLQPEEKVVSGSYRVLRSIKEGDKVEEITKHKRESK
ncbi:MAG: efflux RND transporter periplasmic adaptor subunit [candidate division Zixibacteria bacterium]|nr:efflux RND transporter periplasmic adaptor subunit [candidate division Zixibacteria bacterium]